MLAFTDLLTRFSINKILTSGLVKNILASAVKFAIVTIGRK